MTKQAKSHIRGAIFYFNAFILAFYLYFQVVGKVCLACQYTSDSPGLQEPGWSIK